MRSTSVWHLIYEDPLTGLFGRAGVAATDSTARTVPPLPHDGDKSRFLNRHAGCPRGSEAIGASATSRAVDEKYRPEECDESPHRQVPRRPSATHNEHPDNYDGAHDLREGERGERAFPPEGRAQHRHQLDVAPAHAAAADDGDQQDHPSAHEGAERGLDNGWIPGRQRGQAQRVCQPGQRDDVGDDPDPQVMDHDQRERAEQREKLPPPRSRAKPPKGQQGQAERQPPTTRERYRPRDLGEVPRYLVDGGPVEGSSGIKRGAG